MKQVWFIRHAESSSNAGLPSEHPGSIPLTSKGIEQAEDLCTLITDPPELFVLSPYIRTQQTAKPVLEKFPAVPVEIWPIQEYDFLSPAKCAGTTVNERKPIVRAYWERCEVDYIHGGGAESFMMFKNRVITCIKRIETSPYDFIIVFAHGHIIRAAWQYLVSGNTSIDNHCMRQYRDLLVSLTVNNAVIFKAGYDGHNWQIQEPLINP